MENREIIKKNSYKHERNHSSFNVPVKTDRICSNDKSQACGQCCNGKYVCFSICGLNRNDDVDGDGCCGNSIF